jgi:hypothetical protein
VDTAQLATDQFKKYCVKCVLLYYPSTEFESTFNVYWHREGAAGLSCTELSFWEFPFLRGGWSAGRNSIWYYVNGMPQKETLDSAAFTCMVSYPIDVSISVVIIYTKFPEHVLDLLTSGGSHLRCVSGPAARLRKLSQGNRNFADFFAFAIFCTGHRKI